MSDGIEFIGGEVGPEKVRGVAVPSVAAGLLGFLREVVLGGRAGSVIIPYWPVLFAVLVDLFVLGAIWYEHGKFEALSVLAAIVVSLACLPRLAFTVQPPPLGPQPKP